MEVFGKYLDVISINKALNLFHLSLVSLLFKIATKSYFVIHDSILDCVYDTIHLFDNNTSKLLF